MKKLLTIFITTLFSLSLFAQSPGKERPTHPLEKLNKTYCTGLFQTSDGVIFDMDAENSANGYLNIIDWLHARVAGLQVFKSSTGLSIPVIRGTVPGIYVDEMPVSLHYASLINRGDVAMIKVIKTPFMGSIQGAGGAIAIYTHRGEDEDDVEDDID